jgi:hypothetical protein
MLEENPPLPEEMPEIVEEPQPVKKVKVVIEE